VARPGSFGVKPRRRRPEFFNRFKPLCGVGAATVRCPQLASCASAPEELPRELGYFSAGVSGIGTEQRVTVTRVGPCELDTETSSDRQPVR
jgi:hypothetical protein